MIKEILLRNLAIALFLNIVVISSLAQTNLKKTSSFNNKVKDGIYEVVSQEININKPYKEVFTLAPPEWTGIWQIFNGYFSSSLMKNERNNFFDCNERDLGFESFAGTYTVKRTGIVFNRSYSFHPFFTGSSVFMNYEATGDRLTLTQVLHPHIEDLREGTIKIVLRKLTYKKEQSLPSSSGIPLKKLN